MSNTWRRVIAAGIVGVAACGDNVANHLEVPPARVVVRIESAGVADCPFGGSVVSSGVDANNDGALEDGEIAKRTLLCDDAPVQPPPNIVVRLVAAPVGVSCALGGTEVQSGPDRNNNGVLDDDEVEHVDYVCSDILRTRLTAEPPGSTCVAGGVAFQVGRDRDRDGVLGDDEVEQTEIECGSELSHDVTIASASDAAALAKITVVNGAVTLDASGLDELALPDLAVVRGALEIRNELALTRVAMPVLQSVAGRFALTGNARLAAVELPLLNRVGSLVIDSDPALPDLTGMAGLASVSGDIEITNNAALTAANLPLRGGPGSVTIDGNAQLGQVALRLDRQLGPLHIGSNPALTSVTVSNDNGSFLVLDRVTIAANAQLASISVHAELIASIAIDDNPALTDAAVTAFFITGDLAMRGNGPASVSLATVSLVEFELGGSLTLSGPITALHTRLPVVALGDCTLDRTRLVAFDPPNNGLGCAGSLRVTGNTLLTRMPGASVGGSLELRGNPALTSLAFLRQDEIAGDVIIADNAALHDAPALEIVGHVAGNVAITGNPALKSAFGAALTRIDGAVTFDGDDSLGDPELSSLRSVGSLSVSSCGSLTALDLPVLTNVDRIDIRGNAALVELELPLLRQADIGVFDNSHLPACAVEALFSALRGEHHQSGNDDTAECGP